MYADERVGVNRAVVLLVFGGEISPGIVDIFDLVGHVAGIAHVLAVDLREGGIARDLFDAADVVVDGADGLDRIVDDVRPAESVTLS